jgi:hypothetical protein
MSLDHNSEASPQTSNLTLQVEETSKNTDLLTENDSNHSAQLNKTESLQKSMTKSKIFQSESL